MAIKHHSLFWLHRVVCSQVFFPWNKLPGSVCCSYRKISGDTCTGGDIESRLEGELVPCPLAGECVQDLLGAQGLHS